MMPVAFATAYQHGSTGEELLQALVLGYEFGARAAMAQHATAPDYHTSGSWGAVAGARVAAWLAGLSPDQTRHALGIAEYCGPRSQMMRLIDHPSMLKDGAGWGAMAGASAMALAQAGFTGAPSLIVEQVPEPWADLGQRWYALEQYYKPYPVCRWAQAPIEGVLAHRRAHNLTSDQVERIEVTTFHESIRLAMRAPQATDEAQYSTSFPCAVAMVRGDVTPADIGDDALFDPGGSAPVAIHGYAGKRSRQCSLSAAPLCQGGSGPERRAQTGRRLCRTPLGPHRATNACRAA